MQLVTIDSNYIDYLREFDDRVCYNKDQYHTRPYIGVLFNVGTLQYFAPLTSSGKGKKLKENPKDESITFFPLQNCELGGINLNNMIPVISGVYSYANLELKDELSDKENKYRLLLQNQIRFIAPREEYIIKKAKFLRLMKMSRKLFPNYDACTCDFAILEKMCKLYAINNA